MTDIAHQKQHDNERIRTLCPTMVQAVGDRGVIIAADWTTYFDDGRPETGIVCVRLPQSQHVVWTVSHSVIDRKPFTHSGHYFTADPTSSADNDGRRRAAMKHFAHMI